MLIRAHIRSNLIGYLALFATFSVGTAYAVEKIGIGGKDIKQGAVKTRHVKDGTLLVKDFAPGQLPAGSQGPPGQPGSPGTPGSPGADATAPAGTVAFFNLAGCPSGWTELTAARGRYIVGLPSGGTLGGTTGTALSNGENRAVGQHNHTITDPGHTHLVETPEGADDAGAGGWDIGTRITGSSQVVTSSPTATGITVNNAGSVAGTNAPYLQLLVCQKS